MAEQSEGALIEYNSRDGQKIKLSLQIVKQYLVTGRAELVTNQEFMLYAGICKSRGLNPFKRDCYLIKYTAEDPAALVVSIDYFRSRAKSQPDCAGWRQGIILRDTEGKLEYREGAFLMEGETLLGGWFEAQPRSWIVPYKWAVSLKPFIKTTRQGQPTRFWQAENQAYMIAKVAESQGLRRLWPDEFQGLFVQEEIIETERADDLPGKKFEPQKIPQRINEAKRKKFMQICNAKNLTNDQIFGKLKSMGYENSYEVTTDKIDELMAWAESPTPAEPPANPQDPANAPVATDEAPWPDENQYQEDRSTTRRE